MSFPARNSDPTTSHESAAQAGELAAKLRDKILDLARQAGCDGLTSNEAERKIADYKANGVSPRFAELVKRCDLVRVPRGYSTKGRPVYATRFDAITERSVIVHWLPEFAPLKKAAQSVAVKGIKRRAR
jgi:hypothetical protein